MLEDPWLLVEVTLVILIKMSESFIAWKGKNKTCVALELEDSLDVPLLM